MRRILAVVLALHCGMSTVLADDRGDLREQLVAGYLEHCNVEHGLQAEPCFAVAEAWVRQGPDAFDERQALSMAAHMFANLGSPRVYPDLSHRAAERATAIYKTLRDSDPADGEPLFGLAYLAPNGPERIALLEEMARLHPENPQVAFSLGAALLGTDDPASARTAADVLWRAWTLGCTRPTGCRFGYARAYLEALEQDEGPGAAASARARIRQSCGADDALAQVRGGRGRRLHERVATLTDLIGRYCYNSYLGIDETTCQVLLDEARQLPVGHPDALEAWDVLAEAIETTDPAAQVTWSGAEIAPCRESHNAAELRPIYSKMLELDPGSFRGRWGMANMTPNVYRRLEALVGLAREEPQLPEAQRLSLAEELVLMAWTDEAVAELEVLLGSTQSAHVRWAASDLLIDAYLEAGDSRAAARVWLERDPALPTPPMGPACRPSPEWP